MADLDTLFKSAQGMNQDTAQGTLQAMDTTQRMPENIAQAQAIAPGMSQGIVSGISQAMDTGQGMNQGAASPGVSIRIQHL